MGHVHSLYFSIQLGRCIDLVDWPYLVLQTGTIFSSLSLTSSVQPQKKTEVGEVTNFESGPRGGAKKSFSA